MRMEISRKKILSLVVVGLLLLSMFAVLPSFGPAPSPTPIELWQLLSDIQEEIINVESFVDGIYDNLNSVKAYLESALPEYGDLILNELEVANSAISAMGDVLDEVASTMRSDHDLILEELALMPDTMQTMLDEVVSTMRWDHDLILDDLALMPDTIQTMLDEVVSTMRSDHDLILDDLQTILGECMQAVDTVTDIKEQLESWFGPQGEYGKTAQVTSYYGNYTFAPEEDWQDTDWHAIIYRSDKLATVTVIFKTTDILHAEGLFVRYYTDPIINRDFFIEKRVCWEEDTSGWTDTAVAWQVYIRLRVVHEASTVWWACSGIHEPE